MPPFQAPNLEVVLSKEGFWNHEVWISPEKNNNSEAVPLTKNFKGVTVKERKSLLDRIQITIGLFLGN